MHGFLCVCGGRVGTPTPELFKGQLSRKHFHSPLYPETNFSQSVINLVYSFLDIFLSMCVYV